MVLSSADMQDEYFDHAAPEGSHSQPTPDGRVYGPGRYGLIFGSLTPKRFSKNMSTEVWSNTCEFTQPPRLHGESSADMQDEYFDHAAPEGSHSQPTPDGRVYGPGPRVPLYVISPWSRGGWVNSQVFVLKLNALVKSPHTARRYGLIFGSLTPKRFSKNMSTKCRCFTAAEW
jgi:hypothetical protein